MSSCRSHRAFWRWNFEEPELSDSPLQRESNLRGEPLTVDIRQSGDYNGKFWVGTPLGDVTGLAGIIERNAAQLTAAGGDITFQAGGSIVLRQGSTLDVSGGFYSHEGGLVKTSSLLLDGRKVAVKNATPDRIYDGVFSGKSTFSNEKWGITQTFFNPLVLGTNQQSYQDGAAGGSLSLIAPSMAIDGELRGITVEGPRQRSIRTAASSLKISFEADRALAVPGSTAINYFKHSPTPPLVAFADGGANTSVPEFSLVNDQPVSLPADRTATVFLSPDLLDEEGFGSVEVNNPDGSIIIPENVSLSAASGGTVTLSAANLSVFGSVIAPGGVLRFTTYNISPSFASEYSILNPAGSAPFPAPVENRGMFVLGGGARLSTAGLITDDTPESPSAVGEAISSIGGEINVRSYNASLAPGGMIDVSGGVYISDRGSKTYGKAGTISLTTGTDAGFAGVIGGTITLGSTLRGYSGSTGGALNLQASLIEVGGGSNPAALQLSSDFFRTGGFAKYSLTGVGAASAAAPPAGQFESYIPAISIAANANLRPAAESFIAEVDPALGGAYTLRPYFKPDGLRSPVSLSFAALGSDDPFTLDSLEVRGDIVMNGSASILTDPGASVSFRAGTITLLGSVTAPGGNISIAGGGSFPLTTAQRLAVTQALPTVHLGNATRLSVAGATVLKPDSYGRRVGSVLDGGVISVTGNILAEKGGVLDASGSSGVLDLSRSVLAGNGNKPVFLLCGINIPPCKIQGVATLLDSNGGVIDLAGSQMLISDATLLGGAGGSTATGGQLLVSSGAYYRDGEARTSADINLVVTQSGDLIVNPNAPLGVGIGLSDSAGVAYGNSGAFALDRFSEGSFSSLSLGGKYLATATPVPFGGNVAFKGRIDLNVSGELRLAAGGVISANDMVSISAAYLSIGQDFRAPENPDDVVLPFQKDPALPSSAHTFAPTHGSGNLAFSAGLIDVGNLSLQNIGRIAMNAGNGDIRGNGTLSVAGNVTLSASKIYPTSLGKFSIFAYDHAAGSGSVTVHSSGGNEIPLSAGGSLSIYASTIHQSGILRAPLGTINLGWDGTDLDPTDSDIDSPYDIIAGSTITAPLTKELILGGGSVTSVSAVSGSDATGWITPFGISPDGQTWIDPRGVNVSLSGLPEKSVSISGESVNMESGAVVDIRGGGDLLASRWVPGNGGSIDLLGSASTAWVGSVGYEAGDLVTFGGETWSARVRHTGKTPTISSYWSKVAESFAIVPSSSLAYAPYNAFNTGANAESLGGDSGFVSSGLRVGDTITLDGSTGLAAGTYTLLPRRYALLPGASLITPLTSTLVGTGTAADGSKVVSGYFGNRFRGTESAPAVRLRFEVAPSSVVASRASYDTYTANAFLGAISNSQDGGSSQQLPVDGGYAAFHGNSTLGLDGMLVAQSAGLGAKVDVSSFASIRLSGGSAAYSGSGGAELQTSILTSWGVDSLVIGGIRRKESDGGTSLEVRTNGLVLDNPGGGLSAADVVLASKGTLSIADGSVITAVGKSTFQSNVLSIVGDGTLLRVGVDSDASIRRTGDTGSTAAVMKVGSSVRLSGESIILDSTYGTDLAADLNLGANYLTLGSGQISVILGDTTGTLAGAVVDPQLVLKGDTLDRVLQARDLTLRSYRSIDLYGAGELGSTGLEQLTFASSGVRGFGASGGDVVIRAGEVTFDNLANAAVLAAAPVAPGRLRVDANTVRLGANAFSVSGYQNLTLSASDSIVTQGSGSFTTAGNLRAETRLITGDSGSSYSITAAQAMVLDRSVGPAVAPSSLGASLTLQGSSITALTDILLPSGQLTLRATGGNVEIGGKLSVEGSSKSFNDLTRYANAGSITLESTTGNVVLSGTASVSVAAATGGGKAGTFNVKASQGTFVNSGLLSGQAAQGFTSGAFTLDTSLLSAAGSGSLGSINAGLDSGGFTASA